MDNSRWRRQKFIVALICLFQTSLFCVSWVELPSRPINEKNETLPLYRLNPPEKWEFKIERPTLDTKEPLASFQGDGFSITFHNFPASTLDDTIPPSAQVSRWVRQFQGWKEELSHLQPISQSGFTGFLIEGEGYFKEEPKGLIGAAFSLHPDYFRKLQIRDYFYPNLLSRQIRADVTIKVVGEPDKIEEHREDILAFIQSFELIEPLPMD